MIKDDLKYLDAIIKILQKDINKMDFSALRKNLDCLIITFTAKHYDD